jgi:NADPH2:quinone reductase
LTRRGARCDHESMRAIQIQRTGGPEVNLIDTYHRSGLYSLPGLPHGLGTEAAGIVEAVGEGVEIPLGRRVVYFQGPPRSYAEARNVPADRLVRIPDAVGDAVAAAALLKGMTVEYLIRRTFAVQPGMTVLFHAAAGGVGTIACQWLSHLGATVIGTVSTEAKAEHARKNGCAHPLLYTQEDFVERVCAITDGAGRGNRATRRRCPCRRCRRPPARPRRR